MNKYNVPILAITETHIEGEESQYEITANNTTYILYNVNKQNNHDHGTGFLIKKELNPTFVRISERVCIATIKFNTRNLKIIAADAPTLEVSENNTEVRDDFYKQVEKAIKSIANRDFLILTGDFNAKIGSGCKNYPDNVGRYGKGEINSSGKSLLEVCKKYDLVATNTLFKHKMSHRTTWTAPYREFNTHDGQTRRNPIRNQIDFIIVRNSQRRYIMDARSYGGMRTDTDHKMVKGKIRYEWRKDIISKESTHTQNINIKEFNKQEKQEEYKTKVSEEHIKNNENMDTTQNKWNKIVEVCKKVGEEVLGKKKIK